MFRIALPFAGITRWKRLAGKSSLVQLIHADRHGFLLIPKEDETGLLEAARFLDSNECQTMISAARSATGMSVEDILKKIDDACEAFGRNTAQKFSRHGE